MAFSSDTSAEPEPLVSLRDVEVSYGGRPALGPFSLDLKPERALALVGPSGCGKSTALRLAAGLERPARGEAARRLDPGETAMVFQAPTLAPWSSALDNVALPLLLCGLELHEARRRASTALERVGLGQSQTLKPRQLSGGMAMRVSLARALASNPRLVLMDEPFAALDEITRRNLADDVQRLWSAARPALLFVTHSVEEAVYMADEVIVMAPSPGRETARFAIDAPWPRPAHFRTTPVFRETVENISGALEAAMSMQVPVKTGDS